MQLDECFIWHFFDFVFVQYKLFQVSETTDAFQFQLSNCISLKRRSVRSIFADHVFHSPERSTDSVVLDSDGTRLSLLPRASSFCSVFASLSADPSIFELRI